MKRREFLKLSAAAAAGATAFAVPGFAVRGDRHQIAQAAKLYATLALGLSDPAVQPKFVLDAPNALDPGYKMMEDTLGSGIYTVGVGTGTTVTGHYSTKAADIFGYGQGGTYLWPSKTFEIKSSQIQGGSLATTTVTWQNNLGKSHLLPVDTSLHWAYSLTGYDQYSIDQNGVPIVTHLHGGHTDFLYDGNPEFFYNPGGTILGPQWGANGIGAVPPFVYDNDVPAGNLWYHDHALGITRLNVYAGMAGFYFVRDDFDPGTLITNPASDLGLPKFPYELAYAIQDRMFTDEGQLFYPAYPGDPFYADFITVPLPPDVFPDNPNNIPGFTGGGPTALAEFFGDHIVVNGVLWPKTDVEPRHYRMRLLNGCDSRFMALRFRSVPLGSQELQGAGAPIPFWVIGSDQGLAMAATETNELLFEPGGRYDIVFDFSDPKLQNRRIIMENIASDAPFGGKARGSRQNFFPDRQTDRIMAFDVVGTLNLAVPDTFDPTVIGQYGGNTGTVTRTRKVALFEGTDEYGRLQPLLGTAEPATDYTGTTPINWPNDAPDGPYFSNGLVGQMEGSIAWHSPTTENPALATEIWEIYNATGDAHPIHLHLVNFEILDRQKFKADVLPQPVVQHNNMLGAGFKLANITKQGQAKAAEGVEKAPKDMVTALPGEVTRIQVTFDKPGRYVWHCHILSHEDHEMMRVLQVTDQNNP